MAQVPKVIGLPPSGYLGDNFKKNSLPVAEFTPGKPSFDEGLNVFKIVPQEQEYKDIVDIHGFTTDTPLKLAFLADNFPTDSFKNEYGPHMLDKITGVVSEGAQSLAQTFGSETLTGGIENASKFLKGEDNGQIMNLIGGGMQTGVNQINNLKQGLRNQGLGNAVDMMDRVLAGARIDFPQVWKGSGYVPSYTMTVRLFNPHPGNSTSTEKYIIGPLASILALGLPRSVDEGTYQWPFFHKIKCRGLFFLNPAVITDITVVKGGDQQQIAFGQNLSIVDVRIEISGLFQTMLMDSNPDDGVSSDPDRPTLGQYLENLRDRREVLNIYEVPNEVGVGPTEKLAMQMEQQATEGSGGENPTPEPSDQPDPRIDDNTRTKYDSIA